MEKEKESASEYASGYLKQKVYGPFILMHKNNAHGLLVLEFLLKLLYFYFH